MRDQYTWRANWHYSDYKKLVQAEARKRTHAIALSLGILTAIIWASAVIHFVG
jgi:hypothetical protein